MKIKLFIIFLFSFATIIACNPIKNEQAIVIKNGNTVEIIGRKYGYLAKKLDNNWENKNLKNKLSNCEKVICKGNLNGKDLYSIFKYGNGIDGNIKYFDLSKAHILENGFPIFLLSSLHKVKLIIFPEYMEHTGYNLGADNSEIDSIILPKNLRYLDSLGLSGYSHLKYDFSKIIYYGKGVLDRSNIKEIKFNPNTYYIGAQAFSENYSLKEISLPNILTKIPTNLFLSCSGLQKVHLGDKVKEIGIQAFAQCIGLKNIDFLPKGVEKIDMLAFFDCFPNSFKFPEGLKYLDSLALYNLHNVEEYRLPKNLEYIGNKCFAYSAPDSIGSYPFGYEIKPSTLLKKIYIPASVKYIGKYCFCNITCLEELHLGWKKPIPYNDCGESFYDTDRHAISQGLDKDKIKIYVPKNCAAAYREAPGWKEYKNIIEE